MHLRTTSTTTTTTTTTTTIATKTTKTTRTKGQQTNNSLTRRRRLFKTNINIQTAKQILILLSLPFLVVFSNPTIITIITTNISTNIIIPILSLSLSSPSATTSSLFVTSSTLTLSSSLRRFRYCCYGGSTATTSAFVDGFQLLTHSHYQHRHRRSITSTKTQRYFHQPQYQHQHQRTLSSSSSATTTTTTPVGYFQGQNHFNNNNNNYNNNNYNKKQPSATTSSKISTALSLSSSSSSSFNTTNTTTTMTTTSTSTTTTTTMKFVDIGANLLDERFTEGSYHGKYRHEPDWEQVLQRAVENGVTHIIITAGTIRESRRAVHLVRELRQKNETIVFGCTVGVHPTRCQQEFIDNLIIDDNPSSSSDNDDANGTNTTATTTIPPKKTADDALQELVQIALDGITDQSVVAIGEIGLDYDRLEFSSKHVQQEFFRRQLQAFHSSEPSLRSLPLFLHNRNVQDDLYNMLFENNNNNTIPYTGVVHSFDDTLELAMKFIQSGLYIGLNGCSLKTHENLQVVKELPLDKILLETDCPYCEIKPTHAGYKYITTIFEGKKVEKKFQLGKMVKGRNEPCQMIQVAQVIAGVKEIPVERVAQACFENSIKLYGF